MPLPLSLAALFATIAAWLGLAVGSADEGPATVRRMIIRDELVIHVPLRGHPARSIEWIEHKGPKCLASGDVAGATMAGGSAIDFVLRDRRRVRAELDSDCAGLDFYGGFYVEPEDEAICAKRDEIRSRLGGRCSIERFRSLEPKLRP